MWKPLPPFAASRIMSSVSPQDILLTSLYKWKSAGVIRIILLAFKALFFH